MKWRRLWCGHLIPLVLLTSAGPSSAVDSEASSRAILTDALHKRSAVDTLRRFRLTIRSDNGRSRTRRATVATKEFEGVLYMLGAFSDPKELRGTAFLSIDRPSGSDHFVYFPAFRRVRRVSSFQQSDPWFGTDLSAEDLEHHDGDDYQILQSEQIRLDGEHVQRIATRPSYGSSYDRVIFFISEKDHAILRMEYYRSRQEIPSKVVEVSREGMMVRDDAVVPRTLRCTNLETKTQTEVVTEDVVFSPEIQREFFSAGNLERSKLHFLR